MKNFKELIIWQRGIQITKMVYQQLKNIPREAKGELGPQLIRSAISIPSNIADGSSRSSAEDYKRFLEIALGASFLLETQLIIQDQIVQEKDSDLNKLLLLIGEEQKLIMSFINKVAQSIELEALGSTVLAQSYSLEAQ
ncbi:MAG: four helix bundle protein [Cyclobacteriaceae bacterium]|nr:four helix bundle protein [Cyclobacteriaceae bacterium]